MKPLHDIKSFPESHRKVLEQQFGVTSAEAFFEHATRNAAGVQAALKITLEKLEELVHLVEGHLTPDFIKRCRQPVTKKSRGVIVD